MDSINNSATMAMVLMAARWTWVRETETSTVDVSVSLSIRPTHCPVTPHRDFGLGRLRPEPFSCMGCRQELCEILP